MKIILKILLFCFFILNFQSAKCNLNSTPLPVILWHGMGDSANGSMLSMKKIIEDNVDGIYVKSLQIGKNTLEDISSGYFIHPNKQIDDICNKIRNDEKLSKGFNAIGFSQGGQFLRALVQRCPEPPMKNLITFGAQHQGIFGLPKCPSLSWKICASIRNLLSKGAYYSWVQNMLVQATYWHDPLHEDKYKNGNTFLSDINNELSVNQTYAKNLQKLEKFVMVKFLNDTMVQPIESQWFEFYAPGQDKIIEPFRQSRLYLEDKLGLRQMDENGKLIFVEKEGDHLQIGKEWFLENIVQYLKN